MNEITARAVSEKILEAHSLLNEASFIVHEQCSATESREFQLAIGKVLGELLLEVANPLYQSHPSIAPEGFIVPTGNSV